MAKVGMRLQREILRSRSSEGVALG